MDDRALLPVSEQRVFQIVRESFRRRGRAVDSMKPLMIDSCHAKRADDRMIVEFVVTVLVDPHLGVPVAEPTAQPRWGAPTVVILHFDPSGRLRAN